MMNKIFKAIGTYLLIMLVIIIVGFIAISIVYNYKSSASYVSKTTQQAIDTNNPSLCTNIWSQFMSDADSPVRLCYEKVAIQTKDLNACSNAGWPCYKAYFDAVKASDPTLCKVLSDQSERDECYFQQSNATGDIRLCSYISPNQVQNSCYINRVGSDSGASVCDTYFNRQSDKDACYERAASVLHDKKWCNKIQDSNTSQMCWKVAY